MRFANAQDKQSVIDALESAGTVLINKDNWVQGYYATDDAGLCVPTMSEEAQCFCGFGALVAASNWAIADIAACAVEKLLKLSGVSSIVHFNDNPTRKAEEVAYLLLDTAEKIKATDGLEFEG